MNIYFDYDTNSSNHIADKYLSRILMRVKEKIISLAYEINRGINRPLPDGYILITITPKGNSKKVFGYDEETRKKLSNALNELDLDDIIKKSPNL